MTALAGPVRPSSSGSARAVEPLYTLDREGLVHRRARVEGTLERWPETHCPVSAMERILRVPADLPSDSEPCRDCLPDEVLA